MITLKHMVHEVVVSEIDMKEGDFTIGRSRNNDLQLDDAAVSGSHAVVIARPNEYLPEMLDLTIRDLGSTNGTFVNNQRIQQQRLNHNDIIKIGTHEFKVFNDKANENTQTEYYVPED